MWTSDLVLENGVACNKGKYLLPWCLLFFLNNKLIIQLLTHLFQVVVATIAFGMGIDKSNVRRIIHYGWPQVSENFVFDILLIFLFTVIIGKIMQHKHSFLHANLHTADLGVCQHFVYWLSYIYVFMCVKYLFSPSILCFIELFLVSKGVFHLSVGLYYTELRSILPRSWSSRSGWRISRLW